MPCHPRVPLPAGIALADVAWKSADVRMAEAMQRSRGWPRLALCTPHPPIPVLGLLAVNAPSPGDSPEQGRCARRHPSVGQVGMGSQHGWPLHPQPIPSLAQWGFSHPTPIPERSQGVPTVQLPVLASVALECSGGLQGKMGAGRRGAAQLGGTRLHDCMEGIGERNMG